MTLPASSPAVASNVYLYTSLLPFRPFLDRYDVTDIYLNRPGEVWIELLGGSSERHEVPELSELVLDRMARQIAALTHQGISREHPLLGATLPDGARIQIVLPPASNGQIALAVRRPAVAALSLEDYARSDAFALTGETNVESDVMHQIGHSIARRRYSEALRMAVHSRRNIIVSGGTSSGKTTFLNALIKEVPEHERLIFIEDTPELRSSHPNQIGLVCVRGELGEARVSANDLVSASLRMRPDRIILGELRGPEAFAFLRAVNSGHPGSMTTIHADNPEAAVEQLAMLVLQSGVKLGRDDVRHYIMQSVDIFVQIDRVAGERRIREIRLRKEL